MDNEIITYLYVSKGFLAIIIIFALYLYNISEKAQMDFYFNHNFCIYFYAVLYIYNEKNMPHNNYPTIAINQSIQ